MYYGFLSLSFPEFAGIYEKLGKQPDGPEHSEAKRDGFSQIGLYKVVAIKQAEQTHKQNGQRNKKGVHHHHLTVDQAQ